MPGTASTCQLLSTATASNSQAATMGAQAVHATYAASAHIVATYKCKAIALPSTLCKAGTLSVHQHRL